MRNILTLIIALIFYNEKTDEWMSVINKWRQLVTVKLIYEN